MSNDIKQAHIVAEKNRPVYLDVSSNSGIAKAELISKTGTVLKTYYSNLLPANLPAGMVLFSDNRSQAGEIFLGEATIALATATEATAPAWAGTAIATDKVIKISVAGIGKVASIGELIELRPSDDMPPLTGRISHVAAGFVEISRVPVATDMSKLVTYTKARVYLKIKAGRFGEPKANPIYSLTILNKNRAVIALPTSFKMTNPHDQSSSQMLELDVAPFIRADMAVNGTNTYGHSNILFRVVQIQSDTSILVDLPSGFELTSGTTTLVSDSAKKMYASTYRSGNMGSNPAAYCQEPISPTTDVLKVDAVVAGAAENDNVLCIIYYATETNTEYNNV